MQIGIAIWTSEVTACMSANVEEIDKITPNLKPIV